MLDEHTTSAPPLSCPKYLFVKRSRPLSPPTQKKDAHKPPHMTSVALAKALGNEATARRVCTSIDRRADYGGLGQGVLPHALPDHEYLNRTVVPALLQALEALDNARGGGDGPVPEDPLQYIAGHLLANNVQKTPPCADETPEAASAVASGSPRPEE